MWPKKNIRSSAAAFAKLCLLVAATGILVPRHARASELDIPADAKQAIELMYDGRTQEAVALAHKVEAARPDHPLGYLIEADILWWNIYCKWSERKYNTIDAWSHTRPADADDDAELALADKVSKLAEAGVQFHFGGVGFGDAGLCEFRYLIGQGEFRVII